ncbi:MAG: hypothetical protein WBP11_12445 [Dokdonella sp.]
MKFRVLALAISAVISTSAFAASDQPATAHAIATMAMGKAQQVAPSPEALDATAFYSNVTTFLGQAFANGGAAVDPSAAANTITRLLCDDITYNGAVARSLSGFRFSIANLNAGVVTARPRIRYYQDAANAPGAYITGSTFNPIAFPAGVTTYQTTVTTFAFPGTGPAVKVWACITFDNNGVAAPTGATVAELNNLGLGIFNPPDRGSSADQYFLTTANGSFLSNNPPGAIGTLVGTTANFGFELLDAVTMPVELQSFEVK